MKHVSVNNSETNASASFHHEYLFYIIKNSTILCFVLFFFKMSSMLTYVVK